MTRILLLFAAVVCTLDRSQAARVRARESFDSTVGQWHEFKTLKEACGSGLKLIELIPSGLDGFTQYTEALGDFPCHIPALAHVYIRSKVSPSKRIQMHSVETPFFTWEDLERTVLHVDDVAFLGVRVPTIYYSVRFNNCYWHEAEVTPVRIKSPPKRGMTPNFKSRLLTTNSNTIQWWFGKDVKTDQEKRTQMARWKSRYNVIFNGCVFYKGSAAYYRLIQTTRGGAIMIELDKGQVLITESKFVGNYDPKHAGGAIYMFARDRVMLHIYNSEFTRNMSDEVGGAIYAKLGGTLGIPSILVANTLFKQNSAPDGGGAIALGDYNSESKDGALFVHTRFVDNVSRTLQLTKEHSTHSWAPTRVQLLFSRFLRSDFRTTTPMWTHSLPRTNDRTDRRECGFSSISGEQCQKKGCIYSRPKHLQWWEIGNVPWCVFPHSGWFPSSPTSLEAISNAG